MEQDDTFMTVPEVAEFLGIAPVTVRTAMLRGTMPHVKKYGVNLIRREDAAAYKARTQPDGVKRVGRPPKCCAGAVESSTEDVFGGE